MSEKVDHKAEALRGLADAEHAAKHLAELSRVVEMYDLDTKAAGVHATLAFVEVEEEANRIAERAVEQQRIANLIALSQAQDGNGWLAQGPLNAVFRYTRPGPEDGFGGLHVAPEIAAALGIPTDGGES